MSWVGHMRERAQRNKQFSIGDMVTRDGSDTHRVVRTISDDTLEVECVRAPRAGWCKVGDREINMTRRYKIVE